LRGGVHRYAEHAKPNIDAIRGEMHSFQRKKRAISAGLEKAWKIISARLFMLSKKSSHANSLQFTIGGIEWDLISIKSMIGSIETLFVGIVYIQ
jgi:hypothetical protein